jgi:hypothetical protein
MTTQYTPGQQKKQIANLKSKGNSKKRKPPRKKENRINLNQTFKCQENRTKKKNQKETTKWKKLRCWFFCRPPTGKKTPLLFPSSRFFSVLLLGFRFLVP